MGEEKRARPGDAAESPRKSPRLQARPAAATEADSGGSGGAAALEGSNPREELNDPNAASLDVMDEKRARPGDAAESPRKSPRLERPAAATEADSVGAWWEKVAALTSGSNCRIRRCLHLSCGQDDIDVAITLIKTCDDTPMCSAFKCDNTEGREISVCLDCESRFCTRHGKRHACIHQHWVVLVYKRPNVVYCFACEECYFIRTDNFGEGMAVDEDDFVISFRKKDDKGMLVDNVAGGLASAVTEAGSGGSATAKLDVSDPWEQAAALISEGPIRHCPHVLCEQDDIDEAIAMIKFWDEAPMCNDYTCGTTEERNIMVCLDCESCFCIEHADSHAFRARHWIVLMYKRPTVAYCFKCKDFYFISSEKFARMEDDKDDFFISTRKKGEKAGGHASGSVIGHARPIKGIPNLGHTCYLNSLVQCLLVLGRFRAGILGGDAPTGILRNTLRSLFVAADSVNSTANLLDPTELLACVRLLDPKFVGPSMQDSHEAFSRLCDGLDREESTMEQFNIQDGAPSAVAPTVTESVFGGQLSVTLSCKCCSFNSVSHDVFRDLSVALPPKKSPAKSVESSPWTKGRRSVRKIRINLTPAIEKHKSDNEKAHQIAERGDSQIPASELEDAVMVKTSEPLKGDSTKVEQISQSKDAVKVVDVLPQKVFHDVKVEGMDAATADSCIPAAPPPSVSPPREEDAWIESGSDAKKNDTAVQPEASTEDKMVASSAKVTTEGKEKTQIRDVVYDKAQDINSLASIEECLELHFEAQMIEWSCENCSKVAEKPGIIRGEYSTKEDTIVREQSEQSEKITCQSGKSSNLNRLEAESTSSSRQLLGSDSQHQVMLTADSITKGITPGKISGEQDLASENVRNKNSECHEGVQEPANQLSDQGQNASTLDQHKGKQVKLDHSADQVDANQKERDGRNQGAIQTHRISKLPPVLTIQLKRNLWGPGKAREHVSFEEILDVGRFMDPSSEDKDNSHYRLVGVIEHLGLGTDEGHFVAYVKPSRPQQTNGSSSWFRASDAIITEISLEEVLKREAYLLFYERMEG